MKNPAGQSCRKCYYAGVPEEITGNWLCRKSPPVVQIVIMPQQNQISGQVSMQPVPACAYPMVEPDFWCGDFRPELVS